ncbi:probable trehalose-phosphate phosphatase 4 isoform X2 [Amborella trichopoda]|uniref:probable trehalose-phosphate phosphatase 4 isoform X2 n=1 Tax=Amborella trichopoda TaxID=13333 RepID=UPI0009BD47FC|nr:probable trehalose-phosphate phosphatase 4 isoform X2 [Amborella trichopoda]|eukprot:XP_020519359.1 probable trehalose-phosphate phosphatase 4 isoform X2 [Amborella trichopoda]
MGFTRLPSDEQNQPPMAKGILEMEDTDYDSWMMRSAVRDVARYFPTAIISGRRLEKVYEFVQLSDVYYAGSHGMDIMAPPKCLCRSITKFHTRAIGKGGAEVVLFQPARDFLPIIEEVFKILEEKTKRIHGVVLENNKFCLSVHYRHVEQENLALLTEQVKGTVKGYPSLCLTKGRKVLEIRPSIKWDKGHALEYFLNGLGVGSSIDTFPLYIGDDRTDEDAFKVLRKRGQGYPIVVSSIPKDTKASYSLRDPSEVMSFLRHLARWRRNSSCSKWDSS